MLDREWDLFPEVYAPVHVSSTGLFTQPLPYPIGGSILEVGCGAGMHGYQVQTFIHERRSTTTLTVDFQLLEFANPAC